MSLLMNPVLVSVVVLCVLCLARLNVLMSLLISAMVGALLGGITMGDAMDIITRGFSNNATTALSYLLLGTFATAISSTGLSDMMSKKLSRVMNGNSKIILLVMAFIACLSQNIIPVHIAFIPILIPPLLGLMNNMKIDRRAAACSLAFGLKFPYITIPFGFGSIFMGIIADNMTSNGIKVTVKEVTRYNWMLGLCMLVGLIIAIFVTYAKPREYNRVEVNLDNNSDISDHITRSHIVAIVAIVAVVIAQLILDNLAMEALIGIIVMIVGGSIKWNKIDDQFAGGIKIMGMISMIMLVAGGYAEVMKATGAVNELVSTAITVMKGNKLIAATVITLVGLLVTMGIGSSFSTVPVLAVIYVPICQQMNFSTPATIILMSAAAALGDAGSPASDTTLGPTSGLNVDGQHNHIWDTCVPTFLHYNIPLMLGAIIISQFL